MLRERVDLMSRERVPVAPNRSPQCKYCTAVRVPRPECRHASASLDTRVREECAGSGTWGLVYTWLTGNRTQSQTRTATGSRISSDTSQLESRVIFLSRDRHSVVCLLTRVTVTLDGPGWQCTRCTPPSSRPPHALPRLHDTPASTIPHRRGGCLRVSYSTEYS